VGRIQVTTSPPPQTHTTLILYQARVNGTRNHLQRSEVGRTNAKSKLPINMINKTWERLSLREGAELSQQLPREEVGKLLGKKKDCGLGEKK